jgi:hypothetical protein
MCQVEDPEKRRENPVDSMRNRRRARLHGLLAKAFA